MPQRSQHTFHIPVMGLAYTLETPIRVAPFGITSAVSVMDDQLLERMRSIICKREGLPFQPIEEKESDSRARRIAAYLDLLKDVVLAATEKLRSEPLVKGSQLAKYFEMLPADAPDRLLFEKTFDLAGNDRQQAESTLRESVKAGAIEVNIMTKVDKTNLGPDGEPLAPEFSDALSALRGFATSTLSSPVVFSAGLNPRLYSYCEKFEDFFPVDGKMPRKKIIIKVSDYRSAMVQGRFLAKKGLWVSEFRIESGLNCGGHAFATDGLLMGPILEEFARCREQLRHELYEMCAEALAKKNLQFPEMPVQRITAQGGLGTAEENEFLMKRYQLDSVGWGSPFLLVPEVTSVDTSTLNDLANAVPEDYYLSHASPLGVPFNNFRKSSSEAQRKKRIAKNRPGSPCYKKFLSFNTEFGKKPICTASREYQRLKLLQIEDDYVDGPEKEQAIADVVEKDCLCEGLGAAAIMVNGETPGHKLTAVTICPGPNLAYFSGIFSLRQMTDHIYGRVSLLNKVPRAHVFINELQLYVKHLKREIGKATADVGDKQRAVFEKFSKNLQDGIAYYLALLPELCASIPERLETETTLEQFAATVSKLLRPVRKPASEIDHSVR